MTIHQKTRLIGGVWNDLIIIATLYWLVIGIGIDVWAHFNGHTDNTFWTPWHGILYSGLLAVIAATLRIPILNARHGYQVEKIVPPGYQWTMLGTIVSVIGGLADVAWHLAFGVETNIASQYSPSHLLLAIGLILLMSGPFTALLLRSRVGKQLTWSSALAGILSFGGSWAFLRALLLYLSPYESVLPSAQLYKAMIDQNNTFERLAIALGTSSLYWEVLFFIVPFILIGKRIRLPFGGWTLMYIIGPILLSAVQFHFQALPAALLIGLAMDVVAWRTDLRKTTKTCLSLISAGLGSFFGLAYFISLALNGGSWYVVHVWTGTIFICGALGAAIAIIMTVSAET